jgi:hypothetical protein
MGLGVVVNWGMDLAGVTGVRFTGGWVIACAIAVSVPVGPSGVRGWLPLVLATCLCHRRDDEPLDYRVLNRSTSRVAD